MLSHNEYILIMLCIGTILPLVYGFYSILNKEKIKMSQFYTSQNSLISGSLIGIALIIHLLHMFHIGTIGLMGERQYFYFLMIEISVMLFISGLHGLINRKKINDKIITMFSEQMLGTSIMIAIFIAFFWLRWH